jgi:hypothetical protein
MINVPVFSDENGTPHISIYVEDEDGTFRRTQSEPLRLLRDDIKGVSISQGDVVTSAHDRYEREWNTPTVTFHYGRPQSFYQFLRGKVRQNRFFVFNKPQLSGRMSRLSLHELQLKNSTSQRKVGLLKEKYVEALELWSEEELEKRKHKKQQVAVNHDKNQPVKETAKVMYFKRAKMAEQYPRHSLPEKTLGTELGGNNPVERDFNKRKNLIREFALSKPPKSGNAEQKAHNKHFFKRFIFTLD